MPELLQEDFTAEGTAALLGGWLADRSMRAKAAERLSAVTEKLQTGGDPLALIADEVLQK
jgi:lipid A disaccharide synthetase